MSVTIHKRDASEFISCHFHYFENLFSFICTPTDASSIDLVILKISGKKNENSLRNAQIYPMYSCRVVKEPSFVSCQVGFFSVFNDNNFRCLDQIFFKILHKTLKKILRRRSVESNAFMKSDSY